MRNYKVHFYGKGYTTTIKADSMEAAIIEVFQNYPNDEVKITFVKKSDLAKLSTR